MPTEPKQWSVHSKSGVILGVAIGIWLAWWYYVAVAAGAGPQAGSARIYAAQAPAQMGRAGLDAANVPLHDPDAMRAHLEQMNERDMKRFYTRCSQEGIARRLDGGEAMACSIGYDVLLRKHFGGDFERLLAWSRSPQAAETP